MPSGKQVLLHLLEQYSQKLQNDEDLAEVSENLRIALLLHGSTPDDMWFNVERIGWLSESDEDGVQRQGLGLRGQRVFLSDLFESMTYDEVMPERVKTDFPDLSQEEYASAIHIIWLQLIATQWLSSDSKVEADGVLDQAQISRWMKSYRRKFKLFREEPGEFCGLTDETAKEKYGDRLDEIG